MNLGEVTFNSAKSGIVKRKRYQKIFLLFGFKQYYFNGNNRVDIEIAQSSI